MHVGADSGRKRRVGHEALCQRPGVRNKLLLCHQVLVQNFKESKNSKFRLAYLIFMKCVFQRRRTVHILHNRLLARFITFKYFRQMVYGFPCALLAQAPQI